MYCNRNREHMAPSWPRTHSGVPHRYIRTPSMASSYPNPPPFPYQLNLTARNTPFELSCRWIQGPTGEYFNRAENFQSYDAVSVNGRIKCATGYPFLGIGNFP